MPIYEYECEGCGKVVEIFQKGFKPDEPIVCPNCGSDRLKKLLSAPVAVIRGDSSPKGATCCGREERCDIPPCSDDGVCRRDR
jgi:putative FmdB family regulatory protein